MTNPHPARRPLSEIKPMKPSRRVRCQGWLGFPQTCHKLARWARIDQPIIGSRQHGPFFYHFCGEHKPKVAA